MPAGPPGRIEDNPGMPAEIQEWMVDRLLEFKEVLGPRLDEMAA